MRFEVVVEVAMGFVAFCSAAAGRAEIIGAQWTLDSRGFAAKLWAAMD